MTDILILCLQTCIQRPIGYNLGYDAAFQRMLNAYYALVIALFLLC